MAARLYLDHHVHSELAVRLQADGHDVLRTVTAGQREAADEAQLEFAVLENRILVTNDLKDFKPLAARWAQESREHAGLLIWGSAHSVSELYRWITGALKLYPDMHNLTIDLGPWFDEGN
jgi:predicted nuclease of predicted toxin-antitoxin system